MADTTKPPYPPNWKLISLAVRERSGGRCECVGECALHRGRRCVELDGQPARWARGLIVLTVAHLDPTVQPDGFLDSRQANLKAMCQRCHLRIDSQLHRWNRSRTLEADQHRLLPAPAKPAGPSPPPYMSEKEEREP